MTKMKEMKELVEKLEVYSNAYYNEDREIISNNEYDKLYDELVAMEKETGIVLSNSVTVNVGFSVLSSLVKVAHKTPMLSLDKTKEVEKLKSFIGNHKSILSWKLDGLTIVITYKNGELQQAITRGNGEIGEDITHNARVFANLPIQIPFKGEIVLRGEGVISNEKFEKINEKLEADQQYKNPRNLCSGTVRQLNSEITSKRGVEFITFDVVSVSDDKNDNKEFKSKEESLKWVRDLGFQVVSYEIVNGANIESAVEKFKNRIPNENIGTDGLVLTFDNIEYSKSLGTTSKFPKDSIAFKWADEMRDTKLIDVQWNTSRTGLMNPIAIFEPVDLEGTEVSRASLHNVSIVKSLELGIGDTVKVYKANMIIPQISENLTKSNNLIIPDKCSVCKGETEIRKIKDVQVLYCINDDCSAKKVQKFAHFVSRNALNIEGFSEETISKFIDNGFLNDFTDIFKLDKFKESIQNIDGFGKKSYENLIKAIEKSKKIELPNFLYALGIDQIGLSNAKLLCKNVDYSIDKIKNITLTQVENIDGFGEVIAKNIVNYFKDDSNVDIFNEVLSYLDIILPNIADESEMILNGLNFVITGDLTLFKNRKELSDYIEKLGGKVVGSVSKKTSYLINNDLLSPSSKNKKAKDLGIPIIDEAGFKALI